MVVGDAKKIRTVVANLTANAGLCSWFPPVKYRVANSRTPVKYTNEGGKITISCRKFKEPAGLRDSKHVAVEIVVSDTGCGIPSEKLESIFREFEQVESSVPRPPDQPGLGKVHTDRVSDVILIPLFLAQVLDLRSSPAL